MHKALFRSGLFAVFLGLSAPTSLAADPTDTEHTSEDTQSAKDPAGELVSRTATLTGHVRLASELLKSAARDILAGEGNRETAGARREASAFAASIADDIQRDVAKLADADKALLEAETRYASTLTDAETRLAAHQERLNDYLQTLTTDEQPKAVRKNISDFRKARNELSQAIERFKPYQRAMIEIEFATEEPSSAVFEVIEERLTEMVDSHGYVLESATPDMGVRILISGDIPAGETASEVRAAIMPLFANVIPEEGSDVEANPLLEIPAVKFMSITLSD